MSLAPRAVLVHRTSEYEELLTRHGTHGQAAFFLSSRGRDIREVAERHQRVLRALADVSAAVPSQWRQARVDRADLDRFLFAPEDVVVVVGQDGLVANAAKYLSGQPVIGIDTEPGRNPGVLVRHRPDAAAALLPAAAFARPRGRGAHHGGGGHRRRPAAARAQRDLPRRPGSSDRPLPHRLRRQRHRSGSAGLLRRPDRHGHGSHRLAAFAVAPAREPLPPCRRRADPRLVWFVREAWPSPVTGTSLVDGELCGSQRLRITVESDRLVAFGDGMEGDTLELTWGQSVSVGVADTALRLVG